MGAPRRSPGPKPLLGDRRREPIETSALKALAIDLRATVKRCLEADGVILHATTALDGEPGLDAQLALERGHTEAEAAALLADYLTHERGPAAAP